jgi:VanZ family protein
MGTELAQSFIPLRSSDLGDLLANGVGIAVGALLSKGAGEEKSG